MAVAEGWKLLPPVVDHQNGCRPLPDAARQEREGAQMDPGKGCGAQGGASAPNFLFPAVISSNLLSALPVSSLVWDSMVWMLDPPQSLKLHFFQSIFSPLLRPIKFYCSALKFNSPSSTPLLSLPTDFPILVVFLSSITSIF